MYMFLSIPTLTPVPVLNDVLPNIHVQTRLCFWLRYLLSLFFMILYLMYSLTYMLTYMYVKVSVLLLYSYLSYSTLLPHMLPYAHSQAIPKSSDYSQCNFCLLYKGICCGFPFWIASPFWCNSKGTHNIFFIKKIRITNINTKKTL